MYINTFTVLNHRIPILWLNPVQGAGKNPARQRKLEENSCMFPRLEMENCMSQKQERKENDENNEDIK